jgi:hypothetical protein
MSWLLRLSAGVLAVTVALAIAAIMSRLPRAVVNADGCQVAITVKANFYGSEATPDHLKTIEEWVDECWKRKRIGCCPLNGRIAATGFPAIFHWWAMPRGAPAVFLDLPPTMRSRSVTLRPLGWGHWAFSYEDVCHEAGHLFWLADDYSSDGKPYVGHHLHLMAELDGVAVQHEVDRVAEKARASCAPQCTCDR